jgi:antitoxin (DNA-binding transcriptional repressor) of toxin-antitoxin stability system
MSRLGSIGVIDASELKQKADEVLRRVSEDGAIVDVTDGNRVIARVVPPDATPIALTPEMRQAILERRRRLAEEIGRAWKDDVSAVDAVAEGRREL